MPLSLQALEELSAKSWQESAVLGHSAAKDKDAERRHFASRGTVAIDTSPLMLHCWARCLMFPREGPAVLQRHLAPWEVEVLLASAEFGLQKDGSAAVLWDQLYSVGGAEEARDEARKALVQLRQAAKSGDARSAELEVILAVLCDRRKHAPLYGVGGIVLLTGLPNMGAHVPYVVDKTKPLLWLGLEGGIHFVVLGHMSRPGGLVSLVIIALLSRPPPSHLSHH